MTGYRYISLRIAVVWIWSSWICVLAGNETTSVKQAEYVLAQHEVNRFAAAVKELRDDKYTIHGFYHTSTWQPYWTEVIGEQLRLLSGFRKFPLRDSQDHIDYGMYEWDKSRQYASLLDASESLYLNVALDVGNSGSNLSLKAIEQLVDSHLPRTQRKKVTLHSARTLVRDVYEHSAGNAKLRYDNDKSLSSGEYTTVMVLKEFCDAKASKGEKAVVYYFHAKGECCWYNETLHTQDARGAGVAAWREEMNAANLEFPSICLRALHRNYAACGIEARDSHFAGNFWWATCAHVSSVHGLTLTDRFDPFKPEKFILSIGARSSAQLFQEKCAYSIYSCGSEPYIQAYKRPMYFERLRQLVESDQLLASFTNPQNSNHDLSSCREIRANALPAERHKPHNHPVRRTPPPPRELNTAPHPPQPHHTSPPPPPEPPHTPPPLQPHNTPPPPQPIHHSTPPPPPPPPPPQLHHTPQVSHHRPPPQLSHHQSPPTSKVDHVVINQQHHQNHRYLRR